jgi:Xaa-Pro aminopeptidase
VRSRVLCDDAVFFAYGEAASTVARSFAERGWSNRTIGIEWSSPNPAAPVMTGVTEALRQAGAKTVPGDWVVDQVRLYKSAAELDRIRRAAAIADDAFRQLQRDLRPGMTELEVSAHLALLLAQRSSGIAATPPLIHSGPEAWRDIHSFPSNRRIETGDIISIDCCGVVDRYHANLGRTFSLGPPSERACRMVELAAGSLGELQSVARLGEGPETAATAADRYVRERLPAENVWWIGGYALGIGFPPSWVGHTYLANDGLERCLLLPGYVSNFENVLVDAEDGFEAGCIDTIVMTESGIELLSAIPREILVAGS